MSKEISIRKWAKRGIMLVNTECLDIEDADHPYQQALRQGVVPEDYGLEHPLKAEFDKYSKGDLINMIIHYRKELEGIHRHQMESSIR